MIENIRRDLAWIPRWSICRVNRRQSVAEHSYFVTAYGLWVAEQVGWPTDASGDATVPGRYRLALYLLRHDEDEALTGDVPGPVKRKCGMKPDNLAGILKDRYGEPARYTPEMKIIKKVADLMDECFYLAGEINSGNQAVRSSYENASNRLDEAIGQLPGVPSDKSRLRAVLSVAFEKELKYDKDYSGLKMV